MEIIKIDHLPVEILMKIFSYLPSYNDVSLVNKLFYNVACSVNDSIVSVSFHSIFLKNRNHQSVMESIKSTQRKISKLNISFGLRHTQTVIRKSAISDAVKIVKTFSATIKYFHLQDISLGMRDFLEILSLLPNAEHLVFTEVFEKKQSQTTFKLSNESLKLHRLKTLELYRCSDEFLVVFNRLPTGVLKKLTIEDLDLNLNLLTGLFAQQSNITELVLLDEEVEGSDDTLSDHIFDNLKLESLEFYKSEYNSQHAKILSKQTELMCLSLREGVADEGILNVITNQLSELKSLEINVSEAMVVPFKRILKLKKLKELTLESCELMLIEIFAASYNYQITTLVVRDICTQSIDDIDNDVYPPMPINVIGALANSVPNLKTLQFDYDCECEAISAVMQHFNFIEVLIMNFDFGMDANRLTEAIDVGRCFNPKLTELRINDEFVFEEPLLRKLIDMYPNLKTLHLSSSASITTSQFTVILNGFKKMESLALFADWPKLTTDYLDCIKDHKNNLKSVSLSRLHFDELPAKQKKNLSAVFDVIKYEYGSLDMGYKRIVKSN